MFVFYFGMLANLTPPVALAAFAGAGIAGGNPAKTGFQAVKLALAGFIVPYIFVFSPQLLLIDTTPIETIIVVISAIIGVIALGSAVEGYLYNHLNLLFRFSLFASAILLMVSGIITDLIGFGIFMIIFTYSRNKEKRKVIL
jgi:TRAP-type uncharacterized transport system fused permease subunit